MLSSLALVIARRKGCGFAGMVAVEATPGLPNIPGYSDRGVGSFFSSGDGVAGVDESEASVDARVETDGGVCFSALAEISKVARDSVRRVGVTNSGAGCESSVRKETKSQPSAPKSMESIRIREAKHTDFQVVGHQKP